ncbi:hypothetical protein Btru_045241 [Bulinus truncatus]|nr:hypothetical protein Btru_045241 [Bulinus truncatus]
MNKRGRQPKNSSYESIATVRDEHADFQKSADTLQRSELNSSPAYNVNQQKRKFESTINTRGMKAKNARQGRKPLVCPHDNEEPIKQITNFQHTKSDKIKSLSLLSTNPFSRESNSENCPSGDPAKSSTAFSLAAKHADQHTSDIPPREAHYMISNPLERVTKPLLSAEANQLSSGEYPPAFVLPLDAEDLKALAPTVVSDTASTSAVMSSLRVHKCNVITPPTEYMHITSSGYLVCALRVKKRILELFQQSIGEVYLSIDRVRSDPSDGPQRECFKVTLKNSVLELIPSKLPTRRKRALINPRTYIPSPDTVTAEEIGSSEISLQPSEFSEANTCPSLATPDFVEVLVANSANFIPLVHHAVKEKTIPTASIVSCEPKSGKVNSDLLDQYTVEEVTCCSINPLLSICAEQLGSVSSGSTPLNQKEVEEKGCPEIDIGSHECVGEPKGDTSEACRNGDSTLPFLSGCELKNPGSSVTQGDATVTSTNVLDLPVVNWKSQDIRQWFTVNDLEVFLKDFTSLDGPCLVELVHCFIYNSEVLYSYLKEMGYTLLQVLKLASKLRTLSKLVVHDHR